MGHRLGLFRAVYIVCISSLGAFAFAFDTGVISELTLRKVSPSKCADRGQIGGVLTLASFERDFHYTTAQKTKVNSNAVSILQGGAFFGCFFIWPITAYLGRRGGLLVGAVVFTIGTTLQYNATAAH
jgi:hypothetical protein